MPSKSLFILSIRKINFSWLYSIWRVKMVFLRVQRVENYYFYLIYYKIIGNNRYWQDSFFTMCFTCLARTI
jgi:hypothetical protein